MRAQALRTTLVAAAALLLYLADTGPDGPAGVREAHAVVGIPVTPVSVAGVARRTTRRVVAIEATAATAAATSAAATTSATAQQQAATAQQQQAVAQQQAATATQQQAVAQQQAAAQQPAAALPVGSIVTTLPAGCTQVTKNGIAYQSCGGVYYRAAFQGNNLVYVVAQP
jgi:nucleoid-associated protein YgaU